MLENPRKTLREAIQDAFSRAELKIALGESKPRRHWDRLVSDTAGLDSQVHELIDAAVRGGWADQLVKITLKKRPDFADRLRPILDMLKAGEELYPEETPGGRIPLHGRLIWGLLPLVIFAGFAVSFFYSGEWRSWWFTAALIIGALFFILAISTLIGPIHRLLLGFYSRDQQILPGIGLSGVVLAIAVIASAFVGLPLIWREWRSLPQADKNDFLSVLVSRVEGDENGEATRYLLSALDQASDDRVKVLEFTGTLRRGSSPDRDRQMEEAEAKGGNWLRRSGADVLVWGELSTTQFEKRLTIRFLPKTYWGSGYRLGYEISQTPGTDHSQLIAAEAVAAASALEKVQKEKTLLIRASKALRNFLGAPSTLTQDDICQAEVTRGDIESGLQNWTEAEGIYTRAKEEICAFDKYDLDSRIGYATAWQALQHDDAQLFERAVAAFREAVNKVPTSKPRERIDRLNNLGLALAQYAELKNVIQRYKEAQDAFEEALELGKQNPDAFNMAPMRNNLGNVLVALGRRERNLALLRQAQDQYCATLKTWTRGAAPRGWAYAQNNLCWTLLSTAKIVPDQNQLKNLNLAICSCRNALRVWRHDEDRGWPDAQDNLGLVLAKMGELENDNAKLQKAVDAHNCALTKWTKDGKPTSWATAKYNLGKALLALGDRTDDTNSLEQAATAFREASSVPDLRPEDKAEIQAGLGDALSALGKRQGNSSYLQEAANAYDLALGYYQGQDSLKDEADELQKKRAEVEARLGELNGSGFSPAAGTAEPLAPQPETPEGSACTISQSGPDDHACGDPCLRSSIAAK